MRSLRIAAVALLGTAISAAYAQQPATHHTNPTGGLTTGAQKAPKTHQTNGRGSHHNLVSGGSDTCATATAISGTGPFNGDNIGATTDGPSNCGALSTDVWYNYTAGFTGNALFDFCGSSYDTAISVYDGNLCTGALLGCDDDSAACGLQSQLIVPVVNGQVYKVQVGGFAGSTGTYTFMVTPPPPPPNCPCSGFPAENEVGCGVPTDTLNGGCNYGPPFLYGSLACGAGICGKCAYNGSTRDLDWYAFTTTGQTLVTLNVNAEFTSNIFIADNLCPTSVIAFNFGPACTPLSVSANLPAGTYTAIVAPDFGASVITCGQGQGENYTASIACQVAVPCNCVDQEGETNCGLPTDNLNGGCNYGPPFLYGSLTCGQSICGTAGWNGSTRDLDWYAFTLAAPDTVTLTVNAEFLSDAFIADNLCPTTVLAFNTGPGCIPYTVSATLGAGTYTAIVAPDFGGPIITCGVNNSYTATLTCASGGSVTSFCFGDGTQNPCPCGSPSGAPGHGCSNSDHPGGAIMSVLSGTPSIGAADLRFSSTGHHLSSLAVWFQGSVLANQPAYGDGLRCVGNPLIRLYTVQPANVDPLNTPSSPSIVAQGGITTPGTIKGYFLAYRDPAAYGCGVPATFNATNALQVVWGP